MKLKKLLAFGTRHLGSCPAMAACGTKTPGRRNTDAEARSQITVTANWDFSVGFLSCHHAFGIQHLWCRILEVVICYNTLYAYR